MREHWQVEQILDREQCDRARLDRDPRFDGAFFTCVRTTRIYCRPICPSVHARQANIFFVTSAAAAERLGFRPCLRCRPETAPGSPAWHGTATTVARAMRIIGEGFLDRHSVEELADRLGVGTRHLARLFNRYVGASPLQVAKTRRVQVAKRLISDTDMPLGVIAFEAGFRSVRRFNDALMKTYNRAPGSFRRRSKAASTHKL
jgi:AraC family transcriptional regulator, regulatory protein of adaptative response / methylated-DNA-[protein]-cysteine methyltransferase